MKQIPAGEVERTMKVQEVILRAIGKRGMIIGASTIAQRHHAPQKSRSRSTAAAQRVGPPVSRDDAGRTLQLAGARTQPTARRDSPQHRSGGAFSARPI